MSTDQKYIRLTGVKNPSQVAAHISGVLIDIAGCIADSLPETVRVEVDDPVSVDLCKQSDRDWLIDLIRQCLADCGENTVEIEVVGDIAP
jgi:hypothetical protein